MTSSVRLTVAFRLYCWTNSRSWQHAEAREALRRILWDDALLSSFLLAPTTTL